MIELKRGSCLRVLHLGWSLGVVRLSALCFDRLVSIRDLKLEKVTNMAFGLELSEPERLTNNI